MYKYDKYKRNFKICSKYRWEITDIYGQNLSLSQLRNSQINKVLSEDEFTDAIFSVSLKREVEDGWGLYQCTFYPKQSLLKFWSLGDGKIRVDLVCKTIEDADPLVDMVCNGNKMKVMPLYLIS